MPLFRRLSHFSHFAKSRSAFFFFETIQINMPVEVVAFMLEHSAHKTVAFESNRIALQVDSGYFRIICAARFIPKPRNGQTAFFSVLFSVDFDKNRIKNLPDFSADIV